MRLSRRAWALSSTMAIALVLWAIWTWRPGELATRRLPDGSMLTLKAATYQERHRVRTGNRWRDYLGLGLPESFAKKLGCQFLTLGGRTNALDFWLVRDDFPAGKATGLRATVFDEHGCEFKSVPATVGLALGAAREVLSFQFQGLRLAPDAQAVDFTFAVTRRVPIQYLVKPSRLSAAELNKDQAR